MNFRKHVLNLKNVKSRACKRARELYLPNGLLDYVPAEWNCNYNNISGLSEVINNLKLIKNEEEPSCSVPRKIILFGATGGGKSYFGNGLLGSQSPSSEGPFLTGSRSQGEQYIKKYKINRYFQVWLKTFGRILGTYWVGSIWIKVYQIYRLKIRNINDMKYSNSESSVHVRFYCVKTTQPILIFFNQLTFYITMLVFDTPGFKDSDLSSLVKNRLLISGVITEDIHAYVLIITRFSRSVIGKFKQKVFLSMLITLL